MSEGIKIGPTNRYKGMLASLWEEFGTELFTLDEAFDNERDKRHFARQSELHWGSVLNDIYIKERCNNEEFRLAKETMSEDIKMKPVNRAINHNEGKPRPSLVLVDTPNALAEEVKVSEIGAKEYGRDNWKGGGKDFLAENLDSLLRHILSYSQGQKIDPKSGCHHLAHVRRRCAIALELELEK